MRKDWFAPYAEKRNARPSKAWATRATRATPAGQAQETNDSLGKVDVARGSTPWATRATPTPDRRAKQGGLAKASGSVARIAQALPESAERRELAEGAENSAFLAVIAPLPMLPTRRSATKTVGADGISKGQESWTDAEGEDFASIEPKIASLETK